MTILSKSFVFGAVASLAVAAALVLSPAGRASVNAAPALTVSYSAADIDRAMGAFDSFKNRLDGAPRAAETQVAAIQGDRAAARERAHCAQFAWPNIPQSCQSSADGQHLRLVRQIPVVEATVASR
ncbi:hypothetical protein E8L99_10240 [Phreatobacter aquaticus]|uniref:UrcA family protein n=1 Tax=Phreatobacter aquaticus TaxID=2570229 RepID=A0A4D7QJI9_9HYPH|nr:hypothetical protein [Phreatobacter aquaticus]QCK86103.1 hypothetical protein E8L99_10240 [Phreatobacter aquaticus]